MLGLKIFHLILILSVFFPLLNVVEGPSQLLLKGVGRPEVRTHPWIGPTFNDSDKGMRTKLFFRVVFDCVLVSACRKGKNFLVVRVVETGQKEGKKVKLRGKKETFSRTVSS